MTNSSVASIWMTLFMVGSTLLFSLSVEGTGRGWPEYGASLQPGFYQYSCPKAEGLVRAVVENAVTSDRRNGAGILRIFFHDCFVEGCDASILIDSTSGNEAEKDAEPNLTLHGYEVIDIAKKYIEESCPGVVSCADILAIAARDSVSLLGGPWWEVRTGRRDGTVSDAWRTRDIPVPQGDLRNITSHFIAKGLSQSQMVTLSGAHTIGKAHCGAFSNRLYGFCGTADTDPSLDAGYAVALKHKCPRSFDQNVITDLDLVSSTTFDNEYYTNLVSNRGLLTSDEELYTSAETRAQVISYAYDNTLWRNQFVDAIQAMGDIGVKTGYDGQIRRNCRVVNIY